MQKYLVIFLLAIFSFSCIEDPDIQPNNLGGNFKALWEIIDTRYCYLDYKNIDWDSIYIVYHSQLSYTKNEYELFDLLGKMLDELKDGHVNLYSSFNVSRYWNWFTDYPKNFNDSLIYTDRYLGENYRIAGGMHYEIINNGDIGYIYFGDFEKEFTDTNIAYIFNYFSHCKGIILDVRNNGGGYLSGAEQLASYFFKEKTLTGYISHKTGPGHSDFSEPVKIYTTPHKNLRWLRPVVILTNRMSYSATNDFVNRMKLAPYALIVGDKTGGGGGLPLSSEIPNGWMIRFSASPLFNSKMEHIEDGINPDVPKNMTKIDEMNGYDSIIEEAIRRIKNAYFSMAY